MAGLAVEAPADGVVVVELDRPPHNLWTTELCQQLVDVLDHPARDAHVLRLRAHGPVFCLGRERTGTTPGELRADVQALVAVQRALRRTRLVTVVEVHGDAAGFGVGVVAACDVAVACSDAQFSFPEIGIDLAPALVLAWLPRLVGQREAFWLTATGIGIPAHRAHELGLLNGVVDGPAALRRDVDERVALLRTRNPRVHAEIREMLRVMPGLDEDNALELSLDRLVVGSLRRGEARS